MQNVQLNYGDPASEAFFDATQEMLGASGPSLYIIPISATSLRAPGGVGDDQQTVAIKGRYRFNTANADAAHPGGAAGTYDVYVTGSDNAFVAGNPPVDNTDYTFGLAIRAQGSPPTTPLYRKVGEVEWSGSAITRWIQLVGRRDDAPKTPTAPLPGVTPETIRLAPAQTAPAAVVLKSDGTVASSLTAAGGATFTSDVGLSSAAVLSWNGDTDLYRSAAGVLKTDGSLQAVANLVARQGAASQTSIGNVGPAGQSGIALGADASIYYSGTNALRTDDALTVAGTLSGLGVVSAGTGFNVGGTPLASTHLTDTAALARLASPAFTGTPTAPTAAVDTNTTQLATTAFVVGQGYAKLAGPGFSGTPTAPTAAVDTNTTQLATTAFVLAQAGAALPLADGTAATGTSTRYARQDHVHPADLSRAPLASPAFTGTPTAPTAPPDTNTTQLATTAFVLAQAATQAASGLPLVDGGAGGMGTSLRYARADHFHPTDTSRAPTASPVFTGVVTAASTFTSGLGGAGQVRLSSGGVAQIEFGAAADANLYRSAAARLRTDGGFDAMSAGTSATGGAIRAAGLAAANSWGFVAVVSGEANERLGIKLDGSGRPTLAFGPGGASVTDTTLYRWGVGALRTDSSLTVSTTGNATTLDLYTATGSVALAARQTGDANPRIMVDASAASISFGPGSAALDTNLYRSAVATLKTDGSFVVGGNLTVTGTAAFTGAPTAPTAAAGTNTTQIATTAFVLQNGGAPLASPTFTGTPAAPTAAAGTNTTQIATTAFVIGQAATAAPLMDGNAATGTSTRYARQDHVHATDTSRASATNTEPAFDQWKLVGERVGEIRGSTPSQVLILGQSGDTPIGPNGGGIGAGFYYPEGYRAFWLNPADFPGGTRQVRFWVAGNVFMNNVAPGLDFRMGLYPVTDMGGPANGAPYITSVGAVSGGGVSEAVVSQPAASSMNIAGGGQFTLGGAGWYCLAVWISGTMPASAYADISVRLLVHQV